MAERERFVPLGLISSTRAFQFYNLFSICGRQPFDFKIRLPCRLIVIFDGVKGPVEGKLLSSACDPKFLSGICEPRGTLTVSAGFSVRGT